MNDLSRPGAAEAPRSTPAEPRPDIPAPRRRRWPWLLLALALLAGGGWYAWRQGWLPIPGLPTPATTAATTPAGPGGPRGGRIAIPVTAAEATVQDLPIMLEALGTAQASNTVTIIPQVSGRIIEIAFQEGQEVKAGDVLVRIDPRPFQASLNQALATRAQHEAQLANARLDLQRYTALLRSNGASQQMVDTQRATVAQLEAQLQVDDAAIDAARTQLDYATIRSPIDGRVGLRQVDVGNLVQPGGATGIVVVTQIRPISVTFTLPQQSLPQVMEALAAGPVAVEALLAETAPPRPDGSAPPPNPVGRLVTVDNQVDATTGTIRLKATFENADQRLWPGAFVNVRLQVALLRDVTVLPLVAVQRGPNGPYAFVVTPQSTAQQRPLVLGTVSGTLAVVRSGMQPGERAVTSGALRLVDGSPIQVAEPARPPSTPPRRRGAGAQQQPPAQGGTPAAPAAAPARAP
jgi:multidrug efflux system membrane fusion protein